MSDVDPRGLHAKYHVVRTDGTSAPGGKHEHCSFFVLDLTHDPAAHVALAAYAAAVAEEATAPGGKARPALAADLLALIHARSAKDAAELRPACPVPECDLPAGHPGPHWNVTP